MIGLRQVPIMITGGAKICASLFLLVGLSTSSAARQAPRSTDWSCLDTSQLSRSTGAPSKEVVQAVAKHYTDDPAIRGSTDLELYRTYIDRRTGSQALLFDISDFDDQMVIYVIDGEGRIADRFLTSTWDSPARNGPHGRNYRTACFNQR